MNTYTHKETARILGITPRILEHRRQNCAPEESPSYSRVGLRVAYSEAAIRDWALAELEAAQELYNARISRLSRANANSKAVA